MIIHNYLPDFVQIILCQTILAYQFMRALRKYTGDNKNKKMTQQSYPSCFSSKIRLIHIHIRLFPYNYFE